MNKKGIYGKLAVRLSLTAVCAAVMVFGPMAKKAEAITSGNLEVGINDESESSLDGASIFDITNMMPGDSETKMITIKNDGNLAMKCKPVLALGTESGLEDVLKCTVKVDDAEIYDGLISGFDGANYEINVGDSVLCEITVYLGTDCGNECAGKSAAVDFTVYATQDTAERD